MIDFDIHAPMDAPLRAREARERRELEEARKALQSPEVQKKIAEIALAAMHELHGRPFKNDGTPDRRYGPRTGPPR